jgi:hypothetical protein
MKPGPPHIAHKTSRESLELSIRSWELMLRTWSQIASNTQDRDLRGNAEAKAAQCVSELARLREAVAEFDSGRWPAT